MNCPCCACGCPGSCLPIRPDEAVSLRAGLLAALKARGQAAAQSPQDARKRRGNQLANNQDAVRADPAPSEHVKRPPATPGIEVPGPPSRVVAVYNFEEASETPLASGYAQRPPPLPRPRSRRGLPPSEECSSGDRTPGYGETAHRPSAPSNPKAPAWTAELIEMRAWEAKWAELKEEAEEATAECSEEVMRPQSMTATLLNDLRAETVQISADSEKWAVGLWSGLSRARKRVATLSQNATPQNVEQLRPIARGIERELAAFKAQQRQQFDALAAEEFTFEEVLPVLSRRYDAWLAEPSALLKPQEPAPNTSSASRSASPRNAAPAPPEDPELRELRSALDTLEAEEKRAGGSTGGWNAADHEVFIRVARMFKMQATPVFFTRLEERFPSFSKGYIADHARWLAEHEQGQATKRKLLSRWRDRKSEIEREAADAMVEATAEESERKRQTSEREQRQRAETKRKLAEWKGRRAEEEEAMVERQRREDAAQARLEKEQRRQQLQQRELVEFHRRRREAARQAQEDEEKAAQAATASRRALSQDSKQRIARRSMDVLRRKLQAQGGPTPRAATRSPSPLSRNQRAAFEHVESRLYDTTESFIQKIKGQPPTEDSVLLGETEAAWKGQIRGATSAAPRAVQH